MSPYFAQTIIFLHHDERWNNARSYIFDTLGRGYTTCLFGVILTFVCPFLFGLNNIVFGLTVTNGKFGINTIKHVIMAMQQELVILHNISLFNSNYDKQRSFCRRCFDLVIGYLFYLVPIGSFGFCLLFAAPQGSLQTICSKMNATFLLNNSIPAEVDMEEMFQMRLESYRRSSIIHQSTKMIFTVNLGAHKLWAFGHRISAITEATMPALLEWCPFLEQISPE